MTEPLTLDGELDRQFKSVRRGEASAVACPWCGDRISELEPEDCCNELTEARARLAQAHLKSIDKQAAGARSGAWKGITCPYCDQINHPDNLQSQAHWKRPNINPYCCDLFFSAVMRLADHKAVQDQIDHARRIQDKVAKASRN